MPMLIVSMALLPFAAAIDDDADAALARYADATTATRDDRDE